MEKVLEYVASHIFTLKKISDVAEGLNVSYETLRKKFLKREKVSLAHYILQWKVRYMEEALLATDYPCKVICYDVGLREDYGARVFKNITGMTMEQYRARYKPVLERWREYLSCEVDPFPIHSKVKQQQTITDKTRKLSSVLLCFQFDEFIQRIQPAGEIPTSQNNNTTQTTRPKNSSSLPPPPKKNAGRNISEGSFGHRDHS